MRRERKREEKERWFLSRQERLRERRQRKNSSPVEACQPAGDEHAGGRNVSAEGMEGSPGEIAAAGFFPDSWSRTGLGEWQMNKGSSPGFLAGIFLG
jgi:hypothetical protein